MNKSRGGGKNESQIDRFRETARELGCDEDEAAFRDKLRVIARQKPKDDAQHAAKRKGSR